MTKEDFVFSWQIVRGLNNRTVFKNLDSLAKSIKENGLIHQILIRPLNRYIDPQTRETGIKPHDGWLQLYQLVAGERRFRAISQVLQMEQIPLSWVNVREMDAETANELMLIENLGREQLNPVDEAEGYRDGMERHDWSVEEIADFSGHSIDRIRRRLHLLDLAGTILEMVRSGVLDVTYAEKITVLSPAGQQAAVNLLAKTPNISMNTFERFRNQVREEESQEMLFDLVQFWTDQVQNQKWAANGNGAEIDVPVDENAPAVLVRPHDKTGDVIHRYIQTLMDTNGYEDVAPVLGTLYSSLVRKRKIQVPAPRPVVMGQE